MQTDLWSAEDGVDPTDIITPKCERRSSLFLTRFEVAKIVGERAKQIGSNAMLSATNQLLIAAAAGLHGSQQLSNGGMTPERSQSSVTGTPVQPWRRLPERSQVFQLAERSTNPLSRVIDPVMMAKHELVEKRISMVLKRTFPDGRCETIPVQELEVDRTMLDLRL